MVDTPYSMVLDELERLGVEYEIERGGKHYKFYFDGPQGEKRILVTSATPTDKRAIRNALAMLKRMLREVGGNTHVFDATESVVGPRPWAVDGLRAMDELRGTTSFFGIDTRFTTNGVTEDVVFAPTEHEGETTMDGQLEKVPPLDDAAARVGSNGEAVTRTHNVGSAMKDTAGFPTVGKQHNGPGMALRAPFQEFLDARSLLDVSEGELASRIGYSIGAPTGWRKMNEIPLSVSLALKYILEVETGNVKERVVEKVIPAKPRKLVVMLADPAEEKTAAVLQMIKALGLKPMEVDL